MKALEPSLERQIARAERGWKWLRFWRWSSLLGSGLCAVLLALGLLAQGGLVRNPAIAALSIVALVLAAMAGFVTITTVAAVSKRPRPWLASALEHVWAPLLDRLNTLVHLEARRGDPEVAPYFRRIERQARSVLPMGGLPSPFSSRSVALHGLAFLVAAAATIAFYARYQPWERLSWDDGVHVTPRERVDVPPMEPPKANAAEVKSSTAWGEVRITEPGRDLKVTKVDVVPLQVEAASEQALRKAAWFTAANGGERQEHALPPPSEPNYAVYKPLLYVDEMGLQDWDLLSYYASASTSGGARFASEVYFIEVRPFREDVLKMPGGEGGKGYKGLNELTGLIDRQRQILRETHRYEQQPPDRPELKKQDRGKLVGAETDLGEATRHLYARMATEMENQPIGDVLTHLARAEERIDDARDALAQEAPDAVAKEQAALAELVATRKSFHKAVSEHPEAFGDPPPEEDENVPVADLPDKLKQVLEFRDQQKAAEELVRKTLEEQKRIAAACRKGGSGAYDRLAAEEEKAAEPLRDMQASQPRLFKGSEKEAVAAARAMRAAGEALRNKAQDAPDAQSRAVDALEALQGAMGRQRQAGDLTHAYKLKELLDKHAEQMGRMQAEPGKFSEADAEAAAGGARTATRELKKTVEEKPVRDAFGPGLGRALSERQQRDLEARLDALAKASSGQERGKAAGAAKEGLERVTKAFEESQPPSVKELKADRLKTDEEEALERALQELESLVAQGEAKRALSPEDEGRQRRELLLNLRRGMKGRYDRSPKGARLVVRLEEALAKDLTPAEKVKLKQLLEEIEQFRVETADARLAKPGQGGVTHVDPSRLPAAYRDRIQRYYRKLSEQ